MTHHTRQHAGRTIVGIFQERSEAERAIDALLQAGFDRDRISVVMRSAEEGKRMAHETGLKETQVKTGAATGGGIGAVLGGAAGIMAGLGLLAIPGIGPLLAAGPIAAGLGGAVAGGAVGGLVGALVGLGVPEEEAKLYETDVREGRILVAVQCDGQCDRARTSLVDAGALNLRSGERTWAGTMPGREAYGPRGEAEWRKIR